MKRFWLVLLSLGLVMAFSASAFAVDVKFSGSMYTAGMYVNRTTLNDESASNGPSTAFMFSRLRVQTDFIVSPGLSVVARFDALERVWGGTRATPGTTAGLLSQGTVAENENIAFDYAYIQFMTPIGLFRSGSMAAGAWGTAFGDSTGPAFRPLLWISNPMAGFTFLALAQKAVDGSYTAFNTTATRSDFDYDIYAAGFMFNAKGISAGLAYYYYISAATRGLTPAYKGKSHRLDPYFIANFGPVALQGEINFRWGKLNEYENGVTPDIKIEALAGWLDAVVTLGPVYFGGMAAYVSGDKPDTTDVNESGFNGGLDLNPTLIMWNADRAQWFGALGSVATTGFPASNGFVNGYFFQVKAGVKPIEKLDIMASVSYAKADQVAANWVSKDYGYEIDVTGTYKITNNLSYMLGVGYLITGDYFKGTSSTANVANDYLVINKLTLTF